MDCCCLVGCEASNVNDVRGDEKTPLMVACENGHVDCLRVLVDSYGAHVNVVDNIGSTAVIHACENGHVDCLRFLLENGADVNVVNKYGKTPLMGACERGHVDCVRVLVENGADVNFVDNYGHTPLMGACERGHVDCVRVLVENGADVNFVDNYGHTPLMEACERCDFDCLRVLVENGADVNFVNLYGQIPLMEAFERGDVDCVRVLVEYGADVNVVDNYGRTPLMDACERCDFDCLRVLVENGADVNFVDKFGETPLMEACATGPFGLVRFLVENGADVNICCNNGSTPLMVACQKQNVNLTRLLVENKADVNAQDRERKTPLMFAGQCGDINLLKLLVEEGANVNHKDKTGDVTWFQWVDNNNILQYFIENKANLNEVNENEQTALFLVSEPDSARLLISEGVNVHHRDVFGRTVLFYALEKNAEVFKVFLESGARVIVTDNCSLTLLQCVVYQVLERATLKETVDLDELIKHQYFLDKIEPSELQQDFLNAAMCILLKSIKMKPCFNYNVLNVFYALKWWFSQTNRNSQKQHDELEALLNANVDISIHCWCEFLLSLGADPNIPDPDGNTALFYASLLPDILPEDATRLCRLLIRYGATTKARNHKGETPLLYFLQCYLDGMISSGESRSKFVATWSTTFSKILAMLVELGSDLGVTNLAGEGVYHIIMKLCQNVIEKGEGHMMTGLCGILEMLARFENQLLYAVNVPTRGLITPLHLWASFNFRNASDGGFEQFKAQQAAAVFKHLLDSGAKVNSADREDNTPLHLCQTWSALKLLLDGGANARVVNNKGETPLLAQLKRMKGQISDHSFSLYPDVDVQPDEGPRTFWKEIINYDLDLWAVNNDGESLLGLLISAPSFPLADGFLKATASVLRGAYMKGNLALFDICKDPSEKNHWKANFVELLLKSGVDPNFKSKDGTTALHVSCKNVIKTGVTDSVHYEVIKRLLLFGAECETPDGNGETCLAMASEMPKLKELLRTKFNISDIPPLIPWTEKSERYKSKLEEVARNKHSHKVSGFYFHQGVIGEGAFGAVYAGISSKDGREVAIKRISKHDGRVPAEELREIRNLTELGDCPQVLRYFSFEEDENFVFIVLELMEGNLDEYLDSSPNTTFHVKLCKDLCKGMEFLHVNSVLHRDLKPGNILYKKNPLCLKIADFGLSSRSNAVTSTLIHTNVGTPCWMAPEILKKRKSEEYTQSSDMFACGLVLHYLLTNKVHPFQPSDGVDQTPYEIQIAIQQNILNLNPTLDRHLSPEARDLIERVITGVKNDRITASEALVHPMFWANTKKIRFLESVGNQPEVETPRKKVMTLTQVEKDFENSFAHYVKRPWDAYIPHIYNEMTSSPKSRKYDTNSGVDLLRFIRNAHSHVSERTLPTGFRTALLSDFRLLKEFPWLVIEAYKAVTSAGWHTSREEIKAVFLAD